MSAKSLISRFYDKTYKVNRLEQNLTVFPLDRDKNFYQELPLYNPSLRKNVAHMSFTDRQSSLGLYGYQTIQNILYKKMETDEPQDRIALYFALSKTFDTRLLSKYLNISKHLIRNKIQIEPINIPIINKEECNIPDKRFIKYNGSFLYTFLNDKDAIKFEELLDKKRFNNKEYIFFFQICNLELKENDIHNFLNDICAKYVKSQQSFIGKVFQYSYDKMIISLKDINYNNKTTKDLLDHLLTFNNKKFNKLDNEGHRILFPYKLKNESEITENNTYKKMIKHVLEENRLKSINWKVKEPYVFNLQSIIHIRFSEIYKNMENSGIPLGIYIKKIEHALFYGTLISYKQHNNCGNIKIISQKFFRTIFNDSQFIPPNLQIGRTIFVKFNRKLGYDVNKNMIFKIKYKNKLIYVFDVIFDDETRFNREVKKKLDWIKI